MASNIGIDHDNLNNNMIAHTLLGIVRCNPSYEIKYIMENMKEKYGYEIMYSKAWRSLRRAVEIVYGTWESSVQLLPKYMRALEKYNPGSICWGSGSAPRQGSGRTKNIAGRRSIRKTTIQ
ncbi:hypothetical protein F511_38066 [Dorcoceras hygrometricum]|uniref:Uncharacterized protein n=1 Tax=Dorcoceras hygrometricum TaxID=472368 RepID=A0A2Z7DAW3_9LAMI|nr:hypothetical protein F511_38066 [Dorcoceras hygrometricum]